LATVSFLFVSSGGIAPGWLLVLVIGWFLLLNGVARHTFTRRPIRHDTLENPRKRTRPPPTEGRSARNPETAPIGGGERFELA
jgi:hypothetical protein